MNYTELVYTEFTCSTRWFTRLCWVDTDTNFIAHTRWRNRQHSVQCCAHRCWVPTVTPFFFWDFLMKTLPNLSFLNRFPSMFYSHCPLSVRTHFFPDTCYLFTYFWQPQKKGKKLKGFFGNNNPHDQHRTVRKTWTFNWDVNTEFLKNKMVWRQE